MLQLQRVAALTIALSALLFVTANAAPKDDVKQSIQSEYDAMSKALINKDADGYAKHFAVDFTFIGPSGKSEAVGRQHVHDHWVTVFQHADTVEDSLTITDFTMVGADAVATSHEDYTRTYLNKQQNVVIKVVTANDFRDFWTKTKGVWLLKRQRSLHTSQTKTQNGQPVP